jgi:3-methyladenine DNA glycosylase AlkC
MIDKKEKFELRTVFNKNSIKYTANQIKKIYPLFDEQSFYHDSLKNFDTLNFSPRCERIRDMLYHYLPKDYSQAVTILVNALGEEKDDEELEGYDGFYVMPFCAYIAHYGLHKEDLFDFNMNAQVAMTKRFTAEFSIRYFLKEYEEMTLSFLHTLTTSSNCHVRRLASEGSRPRLPLSIRLHSFVKNPKKVLLLLDALKNESTRLVQRSIANNLNDIAKDNPDAVTDFLQLWKQQNVKDIDWIIAHATRTLVKNGHIPTLELLGYKTDITPKVTEFKITTPTVILGGTLEFSFRLQLDSHQSSKILIDYILYFKKANGELKAKVFKLTTKTMQKNEPLIIQKKHPLKFATTRTYYSGIQKIELQINGKTMGTQYPFELLVN